ncbi:zf-TFIIB domain-containing protein [Rugosimonospora acidiphila]|uniref:Zf-TFIIB domain-containing protein n=1 Tax=Rugosimonospora acidiphila TaxID=556531 RepID=A0ABP9RMV1_9ACTN
MDLICPKCHATMRTYERGGIHIDQCAECRGVFLDRGELDLLIDAEAGRYPTTDYPATAPRPGPGYDTYHRPEQYRERHHDKHRRGFLSDLFD